MVGSRKLQDKTGTDDGYNSLAKLLDEREAANIKSGQSFGLSDLMSDRTLGA